MLKKFFSLVRLLAIASVFLAASFPGKSANYFVDYSAGSDANDGLSTNNPWQHCPGDPTATGNPASASLAGGDTVFFKGGVTYVLAATSGAGVSLKWAGADGNPITYDGNSAGTWGTGNAVFTDNYGTNHIYAFYSPQSLSNLVLKNLSIGPMGGAATLPLDPKGTLYAPNGIPANPGGGLGSGGSMTGVVIDSCTFSNMGYYGSTFPLGNGSLSGGAINCFGCDRLTITNCSLARMRDGIFLSNPGHIANLTIAGCTVGEIEEWAITLTTGTNSYLSNVFIFNCLFTNVDQNYSAWTGYSGPPHRDTIFSFGAEGCNGNCAMVRKVTDTNVCIYNNTFIDTLGYPGGSAVIWFEDNASVNIYNNLFINTQQVNGAVQLTEPSTNSLWRVGVYNNTFYLSDFSTCLTVGAAPYNSFQWPIGASDHSTMVDVRNNIVYEWSGIKPYNNSFDFTIVSTTPITNNVRLDYNLYRSGQTYLGQIVYGYWGQYVGYVIPSTATKYTGWDAHSITGDPLFVNPAVHDFHLGTNSPVLTRGVNLSSLNLPGLNLDRDGNPRPSTGPWTLGAYQGSVARPLPPSGLHVLTSN